MSQSSDQQNCSQVLSKSAALEGVLDLVLALVFDRDCCLYTFFSPSQPIVFFGLVVFSP